MAYSGDARRSACPGRAHPARCLRGHDLAIARATIHYHHLYALTEIYCRACSDLRDSRSRWCLMDPAKQHTAESVPPSGLVLVRLPPPVPGQGRHLQLRLDGVPLGDLDLCMCGPCRRAVLERVRVDEQRTRRGYGRIVVAAALALAPPDTYRWSPTAIEGTPEARAFWAGVGWPEMLGDPDYCTDMQRAARRLPDW